MPVMSRVEAGFCRSSAWALFARRAIVPWAVQGQPVAGDVLEIGAGAGAMAEAILRRYPEARLTVTDFDPSMVAALERRLGAYDDRVRVEQADASALPYADGRFDVVLSFLMLHHTVRWEQVLSEAVRVLRPGGRLVGYDLLAVQPWRLLHKVEGAAHRLISMEELDPLFDELPVEGVRIQRQLAGQVLRFTARRA